MIPVIICGGRGTRLWPLSNSKCPKPFIKLIDSETLFTKTIKRVLELNVKEIVILSNINLKELIEQELALFSSSQIKFIKIYEPYSRNTGPAITACIQVLQKKYAPNEPILVLSSDQLITPLEKFTAAINSALACITAKNMLLFGIRPTYASTKYGYARVNKTTSQIKNIISFQEKPNQQTAQIYLDLVGEYLWNLGIFLCQLNNFKDLLIKNAPTIWQTTTDATNAIINIDADEIILAENYKQCENISIDYCLIEKIDSLLMQEVDFDWLDLGTIPDYYSLANKDEFNNRIINNNIISENSHNLIIDLADEKKLNILAIDVDDLIIIKRDHNLIICKQSSLAKITEIYKQQIDADNF